MKKDLLILGPSPFNKDINHAGGQLTAITSLVKYLDTINSSYTIIDTFRSTFPPQSTKDKLKGFWYKYLELKKVLGQSNFKGAIVFVSYGFGYWEKMLFSLIIEKNGIKTLFFIRSGHFMESVKNRNYRVPIKRVLMNKLSYIGHQGGDWEEFYKSMGIKGDKLIKILNWIEINDFNKSFNSNKITNRVTFLYIGWMVKEKGVNELLSVILENRDLDKFDFIFIGGGTLLEEMKLKTKKLNRDNIKFTSWLQHNEVESYYKKSDVLILPSYAEGFPNVILEALNYGLPIISTDVGAISESVIDNYNGFLIKPRDKEKLFSSILKLGKFKQLRETFSINSKKILIENHSIEKNCKKIFNLF
jgi:glycosyltransferase involved in cell wall biosynthesis